MTEACGVFALVRPTGHLRCARPAAQRNATDGHQRQSGLCLRTRSCQRRSNFDPWRHAGVSIHVPSTAAPGTRNKADSDADPDTWPPAGTSTWPLTALPAPNPVSASRHSNNIVLSAQPPRSWTNDRALADRDPRCHPAPTTDGLRSATRPLRPGSPSRAVCIAASAAAIRFLPESANHA